MLPLLPLALMSTWRLRISFVESWLRIEEIERRERAVLVATHELDYEASVPKSPSAWYS